MENGTGFTQKSCNALKDLVSSQHLLDAFRIRYPGAKEFTFFRPGKAASRLDRYYISASLSCNVLVRHIASLSDHCAALLTINLDFTLCLQPKLGRTTYWKLNTAILDDPEFLPSFKQLWIDISQSKDSSPDIAEWWDVKAKPEIKDFCMEFSKHRKRKRRDTVQFLLSYLKIVLSEKNWDEVCRVKGELHSMFLIDTMGITIRSRYQQSSEEERGSLFHAARELKNARNNINELKINDIVESNDKVIEASVTSFFGALFNGFHDTALQNTGSSFLPDYSDLPEFLNGLGEMSNMDSNKMIEAITDDELENVIKNCQNNKSPYEFF